MTTKLREAAQLAAITAAKCEQTKVTIARIRARDEACKECVWRTPDTCKACRKSMDLPGADLKGVPDILG